MEWLIPLCISPVAAAVYLGGMHNDVQGGSGFRQVLGLVVFVGLLCVTWGVLRVVLGGMGGIVGGLILPTVLTLLAVPLAARGAFAIVGAKIVRSEE